MKMLPVAEIGYEKKYYPRVEGKEDWFTVHRYTDALLADVEHQFPAVHVVKAVAKPYRYMLLDGKHRCAAYHRSRRELIPAEIETITESKWFARSVELNVRHGRCLDSGDKAWIAVRLEEEGYSAEQVASLLHMRPGSLEKIKVQHVVKLRAKAAGRIPEGRGNREVGGERFGFLKSPFADVAGSAAAEGALEAQGPVSARTQLSILRSCIAVLEVGVDMTDEDVCAAMLRLRALVGPP